MISRFYEEISKGAGRKLGVTGTNLCCPISSRRGFPLAAAPGDGSMSLVASIFRCLSRLWSHTFESISVAGVIRLAAPLWADIPP